MKKFFFLISFCIFSFDAIQAAITWTLSDDGTLTISGTNMPNYDSDSPWYSQRNEIKNVVIEDGVANIGDYAFCDCKNLASATISNSVIRIGEYAFSGCSSLNTITIPSSVTSIAQKAFYNTKWFNDQSDGLVYAGLVVYGYKGSIPEGTNVVLKEGTKGIAENAFYNCSGLTSIIIPESVTNIGHSAFYGCSGLFSIVIPNSVASIEDNVFQYCSNLISITIPSSVTRIGELAFYHCSGLTSVTLGNSVTNIGEQAFFNCINLTSIISESNTPPYCHDDCFYGVNKSISVYVPVNSIDTYNTANKWKAFKNIQPIPTTQTLIDGELYINNLKFNGCDISYTRIFNNTAWQALYIPFSLNYDDWKDDFDVAYINGIRQIDTNNDNVIDETIMDVYRIEEGSLIPNTPYLIRAKTTGEKTISVSNATIFEAVENRIDCSTTIAKYTFTGTYETIPASTLIENEYYAMGGGSVIMTDGESDLKPFRWYLKVEARSPMYNVSNSLNAAKAITINVLGEEGETTGISQMPQNDKTVSHIYDLNGRAINENTLKPGMYIRNGKKLVIK